LHHLLAQFSVFRNVALNAIAIGLQFSPHRLQARWRQWYIANIIRQTQKPPING
jgi:hypothetical protein